MDKQERLIDVIPLGDIVLKGDTREIAEDMSDAEMRALIIQVYRQQSEILKAQKSGAETLSKFAAMMDMMSMFGPKLPTSQQEMPRTLQQRMRNG